MVSDTWGSALMISGERRHRACARWTSLCSAEMDLKRSKSLEFFSSKHRVRLEAYRVLSRSFQGGVSGRLYVTGLRPVSLEQLKLEFKYFKGRV